MRDDYSGHGAWLCVQYSAPTLRSIILNVASRTSRSYSYTAIPTLLCSATPSTRLAPDTVFCFNVEHYFSKKYVGLERRVDEVTTRKFMTALSNAVLLRRRWEVDCNMKQIKFLFMYIFTYYLTYDWRQEIYDFRYGSCISFLQVIVNGKRHNTWVWHIYDNLMLCTTYIILCTGFSTRTLFFNRANRNHMTVLTISILTYQ